MAGISFRADRRTCCGHIYYFAVGSCVLSDFGSQPMSGKFHPNTTSRVTFAGRKVSMNLVPERSPSVVPSLLTIESLPGRDWNRPSIGGVTTSTCARRGIGVSVGSHALCSDRAVAFVMMLRLQQRVPVSSRQPLQYEPRISYLLGASEAV